GVVVRSDIRFRREPDVRYQRGECTPGPGRVRRMVDGPLRSSVPASEPNDHFHRHEWQTEDHRTRHATHLHDGPPEGILAGTGRRQLPDDRVGPDRNKTHPYHQAL